MTKIKPKKSVKKTATRVVKKKSVVASPKKATVKKTPAKKVAKKVSVKKSLPNKMVKVQPLKKSIVSKSTIKKSDNPTKIPKELISFAKSFSEKYKKLKCGTYTSDCGKYTIDYLKNLKDNNTGLIVKTPYRVSHKTGIMDFNKSKMSKMSPSFIFNAVIWCYVKFKIEPSDFITADIKSIQCSLENGFSKKEMLVNYCNILNNSPSDLNVNRIKAISKNLKK